MLNRISVFDYPLERAIGQRFSSNLTRNDRERRVPQRVPSELNSFFTTAIDGDFAKTEGMRGEGECGQIEKEREGTGTFFHFGRYLSLGRERWMGGGGGRKRGWSSSRNGSLGR